LRNDTHLTAPTRFIEANGVRYAYRRFGPEGHFKATLPFSFPQVMGYDIAGVVASAPAGSAFKAGDSDAFAP